MEILWHPLVHRRFREELYYFLFRFKSFDDETADRVCRWLLERQSLRGFAFYLTMGVYDALLRVWLDPHARDALLSGLRGDEFTDLVSGASISTFESKRESHFAFVENPLTDREIDLILSGYMPEDCLRVQDAQDWSSPLAQEFRRKGLCDFDEMTPTGMTKFYVAVSDPPPAFAFVKDAIGSSLRELVSRHARVGFPEISKLSLYEGVGFASFLIKGLAPSIEAVMPFATRIRRLVADKEMFTFTMLLGRAEHESDQINPRSFTAGSDGLDPRVAYWITELSEEGIDDERRRQASVFAIEHDFFRSLPADDRWVIRQLIVGAVTGEVSSRTGDVLSAWFRRQEAWSVNAAAQLADRNKERFAQLQLPRQLRGKVWDNMSLGDALLTLIHMLERPDALPGATLVDITYWRNQVQHNRIRELTDWKKIVRLVAEWMPLLRNLFAIAEEAGVKPVNE